MIVRRLSADEISRLKGIDQWLEKNDIKQVRSMVMAGAMDVYVREDNKVIRAIANVSYRATALGRDIMHGSMHVYDLIVLDDTITRLDTAKMSMERIMEDGRKHGYTKAIASCRVSDSDELHILNECGFTNIIGEIDFTNDITGVETWKILTT